MSLLDTKPIGADPIFFYLTAREHSFTLGLPQVFRRLSSDAPKCPLKYQPGKGRPVQLQGYQHEQGARAEQLTTPKAEAHRGQQ